MANPGSSRPSSRPIPAQATEFNSPYRIAKALDRPLVESPCGGRERSVALDLGNDRLAQVVLSLTCGSWKNRACSQTPAEEAGPTRPLMQKRGSVGPVDGGGAEQVLP